MAPHPAYEFKSAAFPIATERSGDTLHIFTVNRKSPSKKCKFFKKVFVCFSDLVPKEKISFVCWYQVRKITARKIYAAAKRNFSLCKIASFVTLPDLAPIIKKISSFLSIKEQ